MPRTLRYAWLWLVGMASAAAPVPARATVMFERSVDELARDAACVVVGVPREGGRSWWRGGRIFTDVEVDVTAVVTGHAPGSRVTVRIPGGVVGDTGQSVPGAPTLSPGSPVLMFLSADRQGARAILSMSAGVFPLRVDARGGVTVMPARTEGLTLLPDPARGGARVEVPPEGTPLAALAARLREVSR